MSLKGTIQRAFVGISRSFIRFPLSYIFFFAVFIIVVLMIEDSQVDYMRYLYSFLVGAALSANAQLIYERFFNKTAYRYGLMGLAALFTVIYYFILGPQSQFDLVMSVKTSVLLFALMISYIWIPTIKKRDTLPFHQQFLAIFKAIFLVLLFSIVLSIGVGSIYYAVDYLLVPLDGTVFTHGLNAVWTLFAPAFFFSLTPVSGESSELDQAYTMPRFLTFLLSYIVMPLIVLYTLILIAYIGMNIGADFWSDNLLEPLLVTYVVVILVVLLLSFNVDNTYAKWYQKVMPKVLLPIALFQTVASIIKIQEMGITHGRYYVILFGIYAVVTASIFSFLPKQHHGLSAALLLIMSAISLTPPIDAFSISKHSQITMLERKLVDYGMLEGEEIIPNSSVSQEDKIIMTHLVTYISDMGYNEELNYFPERFVSYRDFEDTFGFEMTYEEGYFSQFDGQYAYLDWQARDVLGIGAFDKVVHLNLYEENADVTTEFDVDGANYTIARVGEALIISDEAGNQLMSYNTEVLFDVIFGEDQTNAISLTLDIDDAVITDENEQVSLMILVNNLEQSSNIRDGDLYVFVEIK